MSQSMSRSISISVNGRHGSEITDERQAERNLERIVRITNTELANIQRANQTNTQDSEGQQPQKMVRRAQTHLLLIGERMEVYCMSNLQSLLLIQRGSSSGL